MDSRDRAASFSSFFYLESLQQDFYQLYEQVLSRTLEKSLCKQENNSFLEGTIPHLIR